MKTLPSTGSFFLLLVLSFCGIVGRSINAQTQELEALPLQKDQSKEREIRRGSSLPNVLPTPVSKRSFSALSESSPFLRTLDVPSTLILTGVAQIKKETVATVLDLESRQSFVLSEQDTNPRGWQLVEVRGNPNDLETLTAKVRVAGGSEVFSIRYAKPPPPAKGTSAGGATVSTRIGNGTPGGGTGPHGGPDPRVLTPDQLTDAKNGARNIRGGFQADGYADGSPIPPEVISKLSRLSLQQRESVNVRMFEYRNRGLGMPERQKIYNRMLDQELQRR